MQQFPWVTLGSELCKTYLELLQGRIYARCSQHKMLNITKGFTYTREEIMQMFKKGETLLLQH